MLRFKTLIGLIGVLAFYGSSQAALKCVDINGKTIYSQNLTCPSGTVRQDISKGTSSTLTTPGLRQHDEKGPDDYVAQFNQLLKEQATAAGNSKPHSNGKSNNPAAEK